MATSGDFLLATNGDFLMAMDNRLRRVAHLITYGFERVSR